MSTHTKFEILNRKTFGNFEVIHYQYHGSKDDIVDYIKSKLDRNYDLEAIISECSSEDLNKEAFKKLVADIKKPNTASIPSFDVKRSTVTEFMAEFLLEKEFQCIFFEEINKKIRKKAVDSHKHVSGIDVVGFQKKDTLKIVFSEVKASKTNKNSITKDLLDDTKKIYQLDNKKVIREILDISTELHNKISSNLDFKEYIVFLLNLINQKNSYDFLIKNIIVFPFLIHENRKLKDLSDFKDFSQLDKYGKDIKGILWSINEEIDNFIKICYEE